MGERFSYVCATCGYLDKSHKEESINKGWYTYHCKNPNRSRGHIVGDMKSDSELRTMGGSCWKPKEEVQVAKAGEQLSMF